MLTETAAPIPSDDPTTTTAPATLTGTPAQIAAAQRYLADIAQQLENKIAHLLAYPGAFEHAFVAAATADVPTATASDRAAARAARSEAAKRWAAIADSLSAADYAQALRAAHAVALQETSARVWLAWRDASRAGTGAHPLEQIEAEARGAFFGNLLRL